jgi:MFS family permease
MSGLQSWLRLPVLVSGTGMMALVFVAMAPVLSTLAGHLGGGQGGAFVAQMVMSTPAIGLVLGGPLWGWMIGRIGAPRVLYTALVIYALVGASGLAIDSAPALIVVRFIHGVAVAGVVTSTSALIGRFYHGTRREKVFGIQAAVGAGVALVGVLAAGAIGSAGGWRAPFALYLVALVMLAAALAALRRMPEATDEPQAANAPGSFAVLAGHVPFYLMTLAMSVVMQMTGIQTGLVLAEDNVTDPAVQAVVLGMASVSGVLVGVSYGLIRKVVPSSFVVVLILFFWAAGQSWIGLSHGPVQTGAAVALSGIGSGLMFAYLPALLLSRLDQRHHAAGLGLYYSTMFIGDFVNPLFMGAIRTVVPDYHAVFLTIGVICGVIGLLTLLRGLRLRGREDAAFSTSQEQA